MVTANWRGCEGTFGRPGEGSTMREPATMRASFNGIRAPHSAHYWFNETLESK